MTEENEGTVTIEKPVLGSLERTYSECRVCGGTEWLGQKVLELTAPQGLPPEAKGALITQQLPLPSGNGLVTGKVLVIIADYCMDCGTARMLKTTLVQGSIDLKAKQQPGPQFNPNFK